MTPSRGDSRAKVIVYGWVNDADTLRAYGARDDADAVFRRMLEQGDPPRTWDDLLARARPVEEDESPPASRPRRPRKPTRD